MAYLPVGPGGVVGAGEVGLGAGGLGGAEAGGADAGGEDSALGVGFGRRYLATGSTSPTAFFFFGSLGLRWGAG